jgi:hypothetical protein
MGPSGPFYPGPWPAVGTNILSFNLKKQNKYANMWEFRLIELLAYSCPFIYIRLHCKTL